MGTQTKHMVAVLTIPTAPDSLIRSSANRPAFVYARSICAMATSLFSTAMRAFAAGKFVAHARLVESATRLAPAMGWQAAPCSVNKVPTPPVTLVSRMTENGAVCLHILALSSSSAADRVTPDTSMRPPSICEVVRFVERTKGPGPCVAKCEVCDLVWA